MFYIAIAIGSATCFFAYDHYIAFGLLFGVVMACGVKEMRDA